MPPSTQPVVALQKQIVVFLDLLGFRAKMAAVANDPSAAARLLTEYDKIMSEALSVLDNDNGMFQYKGFTDNIVISSPLAQRYHPEERFGFLTNKVAEFQLILARAGWFIRGGIAVGDFYMDERIVFGPALVEAYVLEHKTALFPRIVLSEEARNWMRSFIEFYHPKEDSPQNFDVLVDIDDRAYINYLSANYSFESPEVTREDLEAHKQRVEQALVSNRSDVSIWTKYRWSAQYHDHFLTAMSYDADSDLFISSEALRAGPTSLSEQVLPASFPIPWAKPFTGE
jgi:hypothetical protein